MGSSVYILNYILYKAVCKFYLSSMPLILCSKLLTHRKFTQISTNDIWHHQFFSKVFFEKVCYQHGILELGYTTIRPIKNLKNPETPSPEYA